MLTKLQQKKTQFSKLIYMPLIQPVSTFQGEWYYRNNKRIYAKCLVYAPVTPQMKAAFKVFWFFEKTHSILYI